MAVLNSASFSNAAYSCANIQSRKNSNFKGCTSVAVIGTTGKMASVASIGSASVAFIMTLLTMARLALAKSNALKTLSGKVR